MKPLYLQPLYQRRHLFKHGYPFSAPENKNSKMNFSLTLAQLQRLHFKEMIINEHVRPPNNIEDVNDLIGALQKVTCA